MSTIQTKLYIESVFDLARSITLHNPYTAEMITSFKNMTASVTGVYIDPERKDTWPYYLHLAGLYHELDTPMYITSLDTLETILFDKVVLLQHRATFRAYAQGSRYYKELVAQFPYQETLIRGILNPIELQKSTRAKPFEILAVNNLLIEPQETNLIIALQEWIDVFVRRWINEDYRHVDELYITTMTNAIYGFIPNVIMSIRRENCKTFKAHSFHIWNYLESFGNLGRFRIYLNLRQTMWLYRNVTWVLNNPGKIDTFNELMRVVLSERGIPVGRYDLQLDVSNIPDELKPTGVLERSALNLFEVLPDEPVFRDIRYVMEKQTPLAPLNTEVLLDNLAEVRRRTSNSQMNVLGTKVYESEMLDLSLDNLFPLTEIIIDHWIYFTSKNRYTANISVENPYTATVVQMSVREAFILWLYFFNKLNGTELEYLPEPEALNVRRQPLPRFNELRSICTPEHITDQELVDFIDDNADIGVMISTEAFYDTCESIRRARLRQRNRYMAKEHHVARAEAEAVTNAFYKRERCKFTDEPKTYLAWFNEKGWDFTLLSRFDIEIFMVDIFNSATGADTRTVISLKDIQRAMLNLMSQLGTYSTHYIQTLNAVDAIMPDIPYLRTGRLGDQSAEHLFADRANSYVLRLRENWITRFGVEFAKGGSDVFIEEDKVERLRVLLPIHTASKNSTAAFMRIPICELELTVEES